MAAPIDKSLRTATSKFIFKAKGQFKTPKPSDVDFISEEPRNAYTAWVGSLLDQSTTCNGYNNLISMRTVLVFCLLIGFIQFFRIENQST
jgi:hypothetical protein